MKIVKHLRQDAARLVGVGVAVGLSATSTLALAQAATPSQPDATASALLPSVSSPSTSTLSQPGATAPTSLLPTSLLSVSPPSASASTSTLSRSIFAPVAPGPTLSPQLSSEIDHQIATSIDHAPATPAPSAETSETGAQISPASLTRALPGQVAAGADTPTEDGAISFQSPLPGYSVNSRFGFRQLSYEPHARMHEGVDIAAPMGSAIHATADGYVSRTGRSGSYGRFVEVAHADGLTSFYAHMSRTAGLEPGTKVSAGEVVGYVGSTGRSTGAHLHFEIRDAGKPLDPEAFMGRAFASAADLPLTQAGVTRASAVLSHIHHPMHMLASWHGRRRAAKARYAAEHRAHVRLAAG